MNTPSFFCDCLRQKQENAFSLYKKIILQETKRCFPIHLEMRFRVRKAEIHWALKYRSCPTGKIIQEELSVGRNISYELSDRQNYQRRGIIWKLRRIKLFGVWALSTTCSYLIMAAVALKRKCCWKIVLETECSLDKSTRIRIFEFPFSVENLFLPSPSLENCHTVLLPLQPRFLSKFQLLIPTPTGLDNYFESCGNTLVILPIPGKILCFLLGIANVFMIYHPIVSSFSISTQAF